MHGDGGQLHDISTQKIKDRNSNICPVLLSARYAFLRLGYCRGTYAPRAEDMLRNTYPLDLSFYGDLRAACQFGCLRAVGPIYETPDVSAFRSFGRMRFCAFARCSVRFSGWSKNCRLALHTRRYNAKRLRASAFLLQLSIGTLYDVCRGRRNVRKQKDRHIPLLHGFDIGGNLRHAYASEREIYAKP